MGDAKKKIAVISPYLNILGGGERFLLTLAQHFSEKENVTLFWDDNKIVRDARNKLGIDLSKVNIKKIPDNFLNRFLTLSKFDELFYMTDGSLFLSPCQNNYLIIQSPAHIPKSNMANLLKLSRFRGVICYSEFVKKYIRSTLHREAIVIPPPVLIKKFKPKVKEKLIISVGRFFTWLHSKKQDILVNAFKKLYTLKEFKDWQLVLIGSVDKGGENYFEKIKKMAFGYPIKIVQNANIDELSDYYGKAKIYWHATGFGEDLEKNPEKAEHFGVTTVEAMSAGCVPLVFNGGGQKEIIREAQNGFLWNNINELLKKTILIANSDNLFKTLSLQAQKDSKKFSKEEFLKEIEKLMRS